MPNTTDSLSSVQSVTGEKVNNFHWGTFVLKKFPKNKKLWEQMLVIILWASSALQLGSFVHIWRKSLLLLGCLFPSLGDAVHFEPGVLSIWAVHLILMQCPKWHTSLTVLVLAPSVDYRPLKTRTISHASTFRHNHLGILLNRTF